MDTFDTPNDLPLGVVERVVNVPSTRTLGIVAGVLVGVPAAVFVVLPLVVTFLSWVGRVPAAILGEILPW